MVKQQPTLPIRFSVRRPRAGQRGVSLVEILVAIVILVVGILTIIRLFPGGFLVVRSGENSTIADRLGQAAIEGIKQDGGALPDGVFITDIDKNTGLPVLNNNQQTFVADVRPDDLGGRNAAGYDAADSPNPFTRDINRARFIKNETITIPAGRIVNNASLDPVHVLRFGPIVLDAAALPMPASMPPGNFEANLSVTGTLWKAQAGDARRADPSGPRAIDDPEEILTPGQAAYLVDTAGAQIAVAPALYTQAFTFVFQTPPTSPARPPQTFVVRLIVPPTTNPAPPPGTANTQNNYYGGWFSLGMTASQPFSYVKRTEDVNGNVGALPSGGWVFGSTTLFREFRCINTPAGMTATFTADPYEYALANPNFPGSNVNIGALVFNPRAVGQQGGRAPLQARISYTVLDWHIIHEDRQVPSQGSHTIRLALNNLKKIGDAPSNPGGDVYNGFIPGTSAPTDFLVLDLDSGKVRTKPLGAATIGNADDTDADNPQGILVSYNGGRVTFLADDADPNSNFEGAHVRVFYAGALDWGVAVQKSPALYRHRLNPMTGQDVTTGLQVAEYAVAPMITMTAGNKKFQRVYFPLCDAGKTVEFDGISYPGGNDLREQTIALDEQEDAGRAYADLPVPGYVGMGGGVTFTAVRGVSVRSVIIWKERGDWKTRNVDTLLTRAE